MKTFTLVIAFSFMVVACEKDKEENKPISLNKSELTLHHDEAEQLSLSRASSCTWGIDDDFVATVNTDGLVTGKTIGITNVNVRLTSGENFKCTVYVLPLSNLFKEPVFRQGESKQWVMSQETRVLYDNSDDFLAYLGENNDVDLVLYSFENNSLKSCVVLLKVPETNFDEAEAFLEERYMFLEVLYGMEGTDFVFVYENRKNTLTALSTHNTLGLNIIYMENNIDNSQALISASKLVEEKINVLR